MTIFIISCLSIGFVTAHDFGDNETVKSIEDNYEVDVFETSMIEEDTPIANQNQDVLAGASAGAIGPNLPSNGGNSLSDLSNTVQRGGIVFLTNNYSYQDGDPVDGIVINRNVILYGSNITIDGGNVARLFSVNNGSSLYISGINFVNAKSNSEGGAIYYNGGSGFINDCSFVNCSASSGGAIYYDGLSLVINNTIFKDNSASNFGAGIYIQANSTIISECIFTNNTAGNNGGAIYLRKNSRQFNIVSENNNPQGPGNIASGSYAIAMGMKVSVGSSGSIGWGMYINITNSASTICIGNNNNVNNSFASTIIGNNININDSIATSALNDLIMKDTFGIFYSKFDSNTAGNQGGAVYMYDGTSLIVNASSFKGNLANDGGAIRSSDINVYDSNFTLNHAKSKGGAILVCGEANIYSSIFRNNTAYYRGGAVYSGLTKKVTKVYYSTFDSNGITGLRSGDYYGGALFDADFIESCVFTNNYAWSGGAIYQWHDHNYYRLVINNSVFYNNSALGTGGGVYAHYGANILYSNFTYNRAGDVGGGVGGWNHISLGCLYINNTANYGGGAGGESMRAYSSVFINNSASNMGGSIWGFNLIIRDNLIINTSSDKMGGAIASSEYLKTTSTFRNNTIINSKSKKGGAVYLYNYNDVKSVFDLNKIINSSAEIGGAVYTYSISTLTNNFFENTNADTGGVIYNDLDLILVNNTMKDSDAKFARHIYNAANVGVSYLTFINNESRYVHYLNDEFIFANLTDDMGNTITGQNITFEIGDESYDVEVIDGIAGFKYNINFTKGEKAVKGYYQGSTLENTVIKTGNLKISDINLVVKKSALIPLIEVGNQTIFEITIYNNGTGDVYDLFILEDSYEGLVCDHYLLDDLWKHSIVDGKHKWTMVEALAPEETIGLFVYFNGTSIGNFTNYAIVGASGAENTTVNATVTVNETVGNQEGINPKLNVKITALHPLVRVGDEIKFEVIVSNEGDAVLHDVTISENSFSGLIFLRIEDHTGLWNQTGSLATSNNGLLGASDDALSWKMNTPLYTNEVLGFFMVFKTTSPGVFTNSVIGKSDKTDEILASDDVNVAEPQYTIEKTASKDSVNIGDKVSFNIIVKNTGIVNLTELTIIERPDNGLTYVSSSNLGEYWIEEADFVWRLNKNITPGESVSFTVTFSADKIGNLTNTIISDDQTANATVEVTNETLKDNSTTDNNSTDSDNSEDDESLSDDDDSDDGLSKDATLGSDGDVSMKRSFGVDENQTGNPLIVLLIVLLSLVIFRKDRK